MIRIITDTTSCLSDDLAAQYKIPVIPQIINFGEESFKEGIELSIEEFMKRLQTSTELPKTAAPPPEYFIEHFDRFSKEGSTIICIHPSAEVSGTVRSASVAAMDFPNSDIRIIDTRLVGSPVGTLVQLAAEWAHIGLDAGEIVARVQEMAGRCRVYFMVATLEYLARGGRIGGASALLGGLLQIKPILALRDGRVNQFERARTHKKALQLIKQLVIDEIDRAGNGHLSIMHASVADEADELANELKQALGLTEIRVTNVPPAIVTHAGPGILGVAFFIKE
jgi:DegV family protein with EDD domain